MERAEFERLQGHAHSVGEEHARLRAELAGLEERARSEKSSLARLDMQTKQLASRRVESGVGVGAAGGREGSVAGG